MKANAEDIRKFFRSLHIPEGGVYILGGSLQEAFIAFTTERDAQLAMRHTGSFLKGSKVTLHISSMEELEHRLKSLLKKKKEKKPSPDQLTDRRQQPSLVESTPSLNACPLDHNAVNLLPSTSWPLDPCTETLPQPLYATAANLQTSPVQSLDSNTAFLLGVCTVLHGLQSTQRQNSEALPGVNLPEADGTLVSDELKTPGLTLISKPGYVRLFGLPASATKEDICRFFKGLSVREAIVNVKLGCAHGCLVKFASMQDACDALHFNQQSLGSICVEVRAATEKMWTSALQECEDADKERLEASDNFCKKTANNRQKHTSALQLKRRVFNQLPSKAPKKPRSDCGSAALSPATEHIVMVRNLSKEMTKTEIKELFGCPEIAHKNVLHLLDKEGNRTDTAFLIFNSTEDYDYAMNLTGCHVGSATIQVLPITKEKMRDMMAKTHPRNIMNRQGMDTKKKSCHTGKLHKVVTSETPQSTKPDVTAQTCLFVRNLPADVQKSHIKYFFCKYKLIEDNISLLYDSDGKGIGEAVVQFKSHKLAALAQRLHGQDFLGTQVLLTHINVKQMKDILARNG